MIFGGTAPFVATALLAATGGQTWAISLYMIAIACISLTAVFFAKETYKDDIDKHDDKKNISLEEAN